MLGWEAERIEKWARKVVLILLLAAAGRCPGRQLHCLLDVVVFDVGVFEGRRVARGFSCRPFN